MYFKLKRAIDLATAFLLLLLMSWIFLIIFSCYLILCELPIFYRQERIGKDNLPFIMWKFRTLSIREHLPLNNRIFSLGRFLRLTSLDELPQLWNIIRGDMSFIGPRPLLMEYSILYSEEQRKRHNLRPGITGWAQVNGRTSISWEEKFEFDLYYVKNASLKLDFIILVKTLKILILLQKGNVFTEEKFKGN